MAGNTINIDLSVQDRSNSLKMRTDNARALNKELDKTVAHSRAAAKAMAASENIEYGRARGGMGLTGASARDFANQAQGLGGLVRLYATWAANIFAVTAAFRALSDAMNVQNMVQGLDQLGAASGMSLGSLAKRFADATGGAVTLKESMEAVVKATSSGLSETQIMKLNQVALKASQALGLNMTDAVSRLTRGITKLEPELLDELGLFTKTGKAAEDYARKVGKSVDSLSDLERRQAFANAVLEEGITKFGNIQIPTNPYDKLAASLRNLGTEILTVLNKVLGPIVDFLSSSPTALFLALTAFTTSVVRQAIPVLRDWGVSLQAAAERSKEFYTAQAKAADSARIARINAIKQERQLELESLEDRRYRALERQEREFQGAFDKKRLQQGVRDILVKDIQDINKQDMAYLDRLGKRTKIYKDLADSIRGVKDINQQIVDLEAEQNRQIEKRPAFYTTAGRALDNAERARRAEARNRLISEAAVSTGEVGARQAFTNLGQGIRAERLGIVTGGITAIGGAAAIATAKVGQFFGVLTKGLGVLAILYAAYEIAEAIFGRNAKEVAAFGEALDELADKTKAATLTAEKYNNTLSVNSIIAKSTALEGLASGMQKTVDTLRTADALASGWDRFIDGFLRVVGKGLQDRFAESFGPAILGALNAIDDPALKSKAEKSIASILNVRGVLNIKRVTESIKDIKDPDEVFRLSTAVNKLFTDISKQASEAAQPLKEVEEGFKGLERSYLELSNTLIDKSPLATYAQALSKQAVVMNQAFEDSRNRAGALNDILKDASKIRLFPAESQRQILTAAEDFEKFTEILQKAKSRQETFRQEMLTFRELPGFGIGDPGRVYQAEQNYKKEQEIINLAQTRIDGIREQLSRAISSAINSSLEIIFRTIDTASRKAAIQTQQALLGYLPKTAETVKLAQDLELQSITLRREELNSTRQLIDSNEQLRLELQLKRLQEEALTLETIGGGPELVKNLTAQRDIRQQQLAYTNPEAVRAQIAQGERVSPGVDTILARTAGNRTKNIELEAERQLALIKGQLGSVEAEVAAKAQREQNALNELKAANARFFSEIDFQQLSPVEQKRLRISREAQERDKEALLEETKLQGQLRVLEEVRVVAQQRGFAQLSNAANKGIDQLTAEIDAKKQLTRATNDAKTAEDSRAVAIEAANKALEIRQENLDLEFRKADQNRSLTQNLFDLEKQRLEINNSLGNLTEQEFITKSRALESVQLELEYTNKIANIKKQQQEADLALERRIASLGETDIEERTRLVALRLENKQLYQTILEGEDQVYKAKLRNKELNESLTERQKAYDQTLKNSFSSMADAIVSWAETGKFAGKDLFKSLLADLARYELRLQMLQAYSGVRGSLLGLGGSTAQPLLAPEGPAGAAVMGFAGAAKGAYFDGSMSKFAKGGMFTNSIVDQPTYFKFAKGTGLMGEAGPEAIMPLKRDNNGNLGVRANGQKTEVIVNNYSGVTATAEETTDSRGNRKVEVVIGEVAANDMSRSGSTSQRAMRSTFGLKPQLLRR